MCINSPAVMARLAYNPRPDVGVWPTNTGRPAIMVSSEEGAAALPSWTKRDNERASNL